MIDHTQELLSQDAASAKKLGISYGKYKALQREGLLPKPQKPVQKGDPRPDLTHMTHMRRCKICGNPIKEPLRKTYCGDDCATQGQREHTKKYRRQRSQ